MIRVFVIRIVLIVLETTEVISSEMSCLFCIVTEGIEEHGVLIYLDVFSSYLLSFTKRFNMILFFILRIIFVLLDITGIVNSETSCLITIVIDAIEEHGVLMCLKNMY